MVTQDDIRRAAGWSVGAYLVQQSREDGGNASQAELHAHEKKPVFPGSASDCEILQPVLMGDEGFEPEAFSPDEAVSFESGGTPGGNFSPVFVTTLVDLLFADGFSRNEVARILVATGRASV